MIPWIREKFAERRARWQSTRKQSEPSSTNNSLDKTSHAIQFNNDELQICSHNEQTHCNTSTTNVIHKIQPSAQLLQQLIPKHCVQLSVYNTMGHKIQFIVPLTMTGHQVILESLKRFLIESDGHCPHHKQIVNNCKLIKTRILFELNGDATLDAASIVNNDELLLIMPNQPATTMVTSKGGLKGPTQLDIDTITKNLPCSSKNTTMPIINIEELVMQSDVNVQYDIRQILISLIETSAYIIGAGPYAKRLINTLKQRLISKKCHESDTQQSLIEMGFTKSKALHALHINNNNYEAALNWLIENENNDDLVFTDVSPTPSLSTKFTNLNSSKDNIAALLVIIRIFCHRHLPPSNDMIQLIKSMGFDEKDVREALKITKNNQSAACDWLIGKRQSTAAIDHHQTIGMSMDSPILKALLASPHVQLSLSNPKIFIAYLSILEDYTSMGMWLGDGETSGIIGHILRTYHEEKHILAINQFSSMFQ